MKRNLGIKQSEDYNGYQKAYQKLYFKEHQNEWQDYILKRRYRSYSIEKLKDMLNKKLNGCCTMKSHKRERLVNILREIIAEKEHIDYELSDGIIDIRDELEKLNREVHNKGLV